MNSAVTWVKTGGCCGLRTPPRCARSPHRPAGSRPWPRNRGDRTLTPRAVILRDGGAVAGFCGFFVRPVKGTTMGYAILPEHRGHGLATEAATNAAIGVRKIAGLVPCSPGYVSNLCDGMGHRGKRPADGVPGAVPAKPAGSSGPGRGSGGQPGCRGPAGGRRPARLLADPRPARQGGNLAGHSDPVPAAGVPACRRAGVPACRRDRGAALSRQAAAYAALGEPAEAARAAMGAIGIARAAGSGRVLKMTVGDGG